MAVTKRLRFEILRRDGHACRYCGRAAPDVRITEMQKAAAALLAEEEPLPAGPEPDRVQEPHE